MRPNVKTFAEMATKAFSVPEPVLEIGSRPAEGQEGFAELRSLFAGKRYIGGDFLPGSSVDALLDTHLLGIQDGTVGTIVMMDTLEHVQDPLLALREAHRAMQSEGLVLIGSVMNFPIHNHPWDYWRFTPAAFDLLVRPFPLRAVWYQGDPLAPHTVLAAARKTALPETRVEFEAAAAALEANWPENADGGPLIRYEPLFDILVRESQDTQARQDLLPGTTVEQTFVCPADNLARIDTKYWTDGRMNFCHLNFQLREESSGEMVAEHRYFAQHLVDGVWAAFTFPPIANSAGHAYRLSISSWDGREGAVVSPVLSDGQESDSERLYVNGTLRAGAGLCFRALSQEPHYDPADYRALSGLTDPTAVKDGAAAADGALLRQVALTQSAQFWQVASKVENRFDALERDVDERLQSLAVDVQDILLFVRALRSSFFYKVATRAGGLFRRRKP